MHKTKSVYPLLLLLLGTPTLFAQSAAISWTTTYQTIDGFGLACSDLTACDNMTPAQGKAAFDPVNGIGLSLFRDLIPTDGSCATACNFTSAVPVSYALSYGVKVWGAPLSPPASMKSNGSTICNTGTGEGSLLAGSYSSYAAYLKSYATQFQSTFGSPLYGISVQNEPNYCPSTYDGAVWTAGQIDTFVKNNLGPALSGTGVTVIMPESDWWPDLPSYADTTMLDPAAAQYVGVVANHDYTMQNGGSINTYSNLGKAHLWETETSCGSSCGPFDPSIANALSWAYVIHQYLANANVNAWHYWRLYNSIGTNDNESLIQADGTVAARFYVLGNWSKFVRPGWVRIGATANPANGVFVTAFKDPSTGRFAIVAINQNASSVNIDFSLSGFPTVTSVAPAITSETINLVDQVAAAVSNGAFSYSLPATSVVTFHGTASSTIPPKPPAAPTNLALTVH